jgi:hypothetical protein
MSNLRMTLAKAADDPWTFFHMDNDTKVKLGVGTTIGSCIVAMLVMA